MLLLEYPVYNFSMVGTEIQHATLWGGGGESVSLTVKLHVNQYVPLLKSKLGLLPANQWCSLERF